MSPVEVLASQLRPDRGWKEHLSEEFRQPYMQGLAEFLAAEEQAGKVLFPASQHCFNALNSTPLENVRVVILGQDPYHGPGQAHGLCFSVRPNVATPPSLVNIFKEIQDDLGIAPPDHGCLQPGQSKACCASTASSPSSRARPAPIRAKAGKPSPTKSSKPSTASAKAWYFCSGAATPKRKASTSTATSTWSSTVPIPHH